MAKGNWILKTQPTKTNHPLNATQGLVMYAGRWLFIFGQILLKYQARVYSNYWKNQISMLMLISGRSRGKRWSSSPWNSSNWPWHFSQTSPRLHSHCQLGKCMYIIILKKAWQEWTLLDWTLTFAFQKSYDIFYHFVFANEFSMYCKPDVFVYSKTFSILCKTCLGPSAKNNKIITILNK